MIDTLHTRGKHTKSSEKLRRARRLYIFLVVRNFGISNNGLFDRAAERMIESGLYAKSANKRAIRFSIIKSMFRFEHPRFRVGDPVYREWLFSKGLDCHSGYFKPIMDNITPLVQKIA